MTLSTYSLFLFPPSLWFCDFPFYWCFVIRDTISSSLRPCFHLILHLQFNQRHGGSPHTYPMQIKVDTVRYATCQSKACQSQTFQPPIAQEHQLRQQSAYGLWIPLRHDRNHKTSGKIKPNSLRRDAYVEHMQKDFYHTQRSCSLHLHLHPHIFSHHHHHHQLSAL